MGRAKLLLPIGDTTVLGAVVRALQGGGASRVVVVHADVDRDIQRWARSHDVESAVNAEPERPMLHSVLCGLERLGGPAALSESGTCVLICPGDLPGMAASSVAAVVAAIEDGALLAVPVHGGKRGHPLAVAPALLEEIPRLDYRVGLRQLLQRNADAVTRVRVDDPGVLRDVDTPEDYRLLQAEIDSARHAES